MVQLNTKAFAADGDLQEKQLSPPRPPLVDSTANRNGNGTTTIWLTIFPTDMVLRVNIDQIEPATRDWICKVQIVEIGRPRESLDKKCTFQNLILEDEEVRYPAIVLRCGPQNAGAVIIGVEKLPFVTIRLSLQTRYNSTLRVNPNYPHAVALMNWAKENKTMLLSCPSEKTSTSSSTAPMIVTIAGQQLLSIAEISSAPSMGVFYVEAEMAILDEFQDFCVLECSGCKQKKRTKDRKDFHCSKCNRKTALVPRCSFQIDLIDNTATTTASISTELGEKILSMTAEDIFDTTCTKLRKSSWASSDTTHATLSILSYTEKQHAPHTTTDRTSKKIKPLEISEVEVMATTTVAGSLNAPRKLEPPIPAKKV
ncbi:hypothetical protein H5410_001564 [Solanum commersonii]|uniref:Replication factor A C-terminal domain-containing protein n=1 Tax=Solanum commersonii TaxID=4109 RepID=A0A9J6B0G5_SOLCO|nr:hypothetical protein H5410_001564 [Solanum commersonii]